METLFNGQWRVGEPQTHANIAVYPLYLPNGHERAYRTLDEALQTGELTIQEMSEGGSVPILAVQNTGALPVLMIVGEELIGAKQNRILNTSVLVAAQSQLPIPVSCVEQGRWGYTSRRFSSGDTTAHLRLRKAQTDNVTKSLRADSGFDAKQTEVWREVTRKISSHDTTSTTSALHDMYQQTQTTVKEYLTSLTTPEAAQGFLVTINGQVVGGDFFDHHETLQRLWGKLIRGYAIDALERAHYDGGAAIDDSQRLEEAQRFLAAIQAAKVESYDSVGLGKDMRLTSELLTGSSLVWEDHAIHTSVFNRQL